jgi:hypothetical protein
MATKEATIRKESGLSSASEAALQLSQPLFSTNQYHSIDTALRSIFPTPAEETKVQKARAILKEVAANLSDQELEIFITQLQLLIETWMDVFEKQAFEGRTLKEVLYGG